MIQTDEHLRRTREALSAIEGSLAALNRQKTTIHPDRYALMVEPVLDHIQRLRAEIDEYIGLPAAERAVAAVAGAKVAEPAGGSA